MTILDDFFDGNINPAEKYIKPGSEYHSVTCELTASIEALMPFLNKEARMIYDKIEDLMAKQGYISEKERFIEGFCLGARIILEIMAYKNSPWISRGE
ncbi:MAG: hypothetical protein IJO47_07945 [Clostridia bacterium]|nr:hypothetical protein [Clostridia bacterium]